MIYHDFDNDNGWDYAEYQVWGICLA
jgi:hypothetical protein